MHHRAISNNRDLATVAQNLTFADFQQLWLLADVNADTIAARIAHGGRSDMFHHRKQHVAHLGLVLRGHQDDIWHSP